MLINRSVIRTKINSICAIAVIMQISFCCPLSTMLAQNGTPPLNYIQGIKDYGVAVEPHCRQNRKWGNYLKAKESVRTKVWHFFATMKQLFLVVSNSSSASNAKTLNRCRKNENSASCVYVVLRILNLSNFMLMLNSVGMKKKSCITSKVHVRGVECVEMSKFQLIKYADMWRFRFARTKITVKPMKKEYDSLNQDKIYAGNNSELRYSSVTTTTTT